jgi:hypothetical protein
MRHFPKWLIAMILAVSLTQGCFLQPSISDYYERGVKREKQGDLAW